MEAFYSVKTLENDINFKSSKKKNDLILISFIVGISVLFLLFRMVFIEEGQELCIQLNGETIGTYSLMDHQEIEIQNSEGKISNIVVIEDGKAYMKSANCADGLCIKQGRIHKSGDEIICLPNRLIIRIEGKRKLNYDAIAE